MKLKYLLKKVWNSIRSTFNCIGIMKSHILQSYRGMNKFLLFINQKQEMYKLFSTFHLIV